MPTNKMKTVMALAMLAASGLLLCGVSLAQEAQKPLTNADVLSMLAQGKPEQTILNTLQTTRSTFDVSKQARAGFDKRCAAIKHPGVTTGAWATEIKDIWDTMVNVVTCLETNGRGGEGACDSIPPAPKNASGATPVLSKGHGRTEYEPITMERGVTPKTEFQNWASSGQAAGQQRELPKIPPIKSNPKRDAAGPIDPATKAQIKTKLKAQMDAFGKNTKVLHMAVIRPAPVAPREVQALQRQKLFVDALRRQGSIAPLKAASPLGANLTTMAATSPGVGASPMLLATPAKPLLQQAPNPVLAARGGVPLTTGGSLTLNGGSNSAGSETVAPRQAMAPTGSPNGGAIAVGGGSNQPSTRTVTSRQTVTPTDSPNGGAIAVGGGSNQLSTGTVAPQTLAAPALPSMRPAPTSQAHPATPSSPAGISVAGATSSVRIAAGSVSGYIFWDTSQLHYQLSSPCQGLEVTLSTASNGSLQKLASSTTSATGYGSQPVWNFSGQGAQGPWMLCTYVFHQVPEGVPLEADAIVSQSSAFNWPVTLFAEHEPLLKNQFVIPGGNCNTTPDSTLATVLNTGSVICGDSAFNVNFAAQNSRLNVASINTTVCMKPRIDSVNGINSVQNASSPVVFTQDPAYNDYIITGCDFGIGEGGQVYLSGAVTGGRIDMTVLQWSSTQIEAVVKWGLTGVLDGWPDLIVVPPGGGTPAKFANTRFYAQRQSVLLPSIPQRYVHLDPEQVGDSTHGFGTGYCGGPDLMHLFPCIAFNGGYPLDGVSNGGPSEKSAPSTSVSNAVDRDGAELKFNPGQDTYDLSYLPPGFAIDWFTARWYYWSESVCEMWADEGSQKPGDGINWDPAPASQYNVQQKGTQIVVDWGVDHCSWKWLGMFNVDDEYNAGYSLIVYVKGPIGVDPWTGQPTAAH